MNFTTHDLSQIFLNYDCALKEISEEFVEEYIVRFLSIVKALTSGCDAENVRLSLTSFARYPCPRIFSFGREAIERKEPTDQ